MSPDNRARYSRAIRDEILCSQTESRLQLGGFLGQTVENHGEISVDNPLIADPSTHLYAKSREMNKTQAWEKLLEAVRVSKPVSAIEAGAEFRIEVMSTEDEGMLLEDVGGYYFYHEPKDNINPFNGIRQIPGGPRIMNRGESLLSHWLFFTNENEEFNYLDEYERNLLVRVLKVE